MFYNKEDLSLHLHLFNQDRLMYSYFIPTLFLLTLLFLLVLKMSQIWQ